MAGALSTRRVSSAVLAAGLAAIAQCGSPAAPSRTEAIFQVRACRGSLIAPDGDVFRILLRDSTLIAQARSLVGVGNRKIVFGTVVRGSGGFNAPWSWHLDPLSVSFPDVTVEICDTCPSAVEANIDRWVSGRMCPWSSEIIAEQK